MGKLQSRRGNKADMPNPLDNGEFGWASDTKQLYVGNGIANQNTFIGGAPASTDYKIYLATTALGGAALSGGATGLVLESGVTTSATVSKLVNGNATFTAALLNKTVYNSTSKTWAKVTAVDSATTLSLSADIMSTGDSYEIADAVDSLVDAYSLIPASYGVNITLAVSDGIHTYAGAVTLGGKSPAGAVALSMQGNAGATTIESTTITALTLGDIITVDGCAFSDPVVVSSTFVGSNLSFVSDLTSNSALTLTSSPIAGNLTASGITTLTTSNVTGNVVSNAALTMNSSDIGGTLTANAAFTNTTSITVSGAATIEGAANLDTAIFSSSLTSNGTLTNATSLDITGNWSCSGVTTAVDVSVGGNLTTAAAFSVTTDLDVTGDITTNGEFTCAGTVTCTNITTGGGAFTQTGSLDITTNAIFNSQASITTVTVGGNLTATGALTQTVSLGITGNLTTSGVTNVANITCNNITTSSSSFTQTGTLGVTLHATFGADATVDTVTIGGNLITNGAFTQASILSITGSWNSSGVTNAVDVGVGGNLTINNTFTCTTDIDVGGDIVSLAGVTVDGTVTCANLSTSVGVFSQTGSLAVTTDATFDAPAVVSTVTIGGNLVTNSDFTQTTSLAVTGSWISNGTTAAAGVTMTGLSDFSGKATITGINTFNGEVSIRNTFTASGTTFTRRVFEYFGASVDLSGCTITGDDGFIITKSTSIANVFRSGSTVVFESDPSTYLNIASTVTEDYTIYVATPLLGGDDAIADGLMISQGTGTTTTANKLVDSTQNFTTLNGYASLVNKTVYNVTKDAWAKIIAVDSANTLSLSANIMAATDSYVIVNAYSTIQSAFDSINGAYNCNITVKLSNGTFQPVATPILKGKSPTGNYSIRIVGTMVPQVTGTATSSAAWAAATAVRTSMTDSGSGWVTNAYKDMLLRLTGGTGYDPAVDLHNDYVIESNNASTLTLAAGAWYKAIDTTTTYEIIDFGTVIDGATTLTNDLFIEADNVILQYLNTIGASGESVYLNNSNNIEILSCFFDGTGSNASRATLRSDKCNLKNLASTNILANSAWTIGVNFLQGSATIIDAVNNKYGVSNSLINAPFIGFNTSQNSYLWSTTAYGSVVYLAGNNNGMALFFAQQGYGAIKAWYLDGSATPLTTSYGVKMDEVSSCRIFNNIRIDKFPSHGVLVGGNGWFGVYAGGSYITNNGGFGLKVQNIGIALNASTAAGLLNYSGNNSGNYSADGATGGYIT